MSNQAPLKTDKKGVLPFIKRRLGNWMLRHQLPFNFAIHRVGIPVAVAGIPLLFLYEWYWGVGALFVGYLLQFIGHQVEGNDVGEWAAIKKMLGMKYVGISPRWNPEDPNRL